MINERKLAELLVDYSLNVQPNKIVEINGTSIAVSLIKELYEIILKRGAYPIVNMSFEGQAYSYYKHCKNIEFLNPFRKFTAETIDYTIIIDGPFNTKELSKIDPSTIAKYKKAHQIVRDIYDERETAGNYKWVYCPYPTLSQAQDAEMSLEEYTEFVYEACGLKNENPILYWQNISNEQKEYLKLFENAKQIRIVGNDVDITANVEGRKWINCDGKCNMPDGEIYTSPVEDSVNGYIKFDYPACYNGFEVEGVELEIKDGIIISALAKKNHEFLNKMISMDEGSNKIGEIAFGINKNIKTFSKSILFDEKIGGTMHMAIGASYPDAGGLNKSGLHWDIVKSMKNVDVFIDNVLIYSNGSFIRQHKLFLSVANPTGVTSCTIKCNHNNKISLGVAGEDLTICDDCGTKLE